MQLARKRGFKSGSEDIVQTNIFPEDLNPHCDLAHQHSNPKLSHNTLARDDAPLYHQVWLQKVQNFGLLFDLSPHCDLDLEDRNPTFLHDTLKAG